MVMELENGSGNIAFAEHQNQQMVAARSNYVLSGLVITASVGSNLLDSSDDIDMSSGSSFNNNTFRSSISAGNLNLSSHYSGLSSGQSRFVFIYINTSGTLVSVAGTPAVTGQQLPPDIVDKTVVLAMIILTYLDTTVDSADIEDWQIESPIGTILNGVFGFASAGTTINEISIDGTLGDDSDDAVPTEKAVKAYVDGIAFSPASVTEHNDVSIAGSGIIISATERTALHPKYNSNNLETDLGITTTKLLELSVYGSSNASFKPCNTLIWTDGAFTNTVTRTIANVNGGNNYVMFGLPLETNRGSLKLYVKDIRVILDDANGSNFISSTTIIGVAGVTDVEIDADPTNYTTGGVHTFERSATDVSQYLTINIQLWNNTASSNLLEIFSLQVEYYYE